MQLVDDAAGPSTGATAKASATLPRTLLTAEQAAREVFGVSERTFHNMRDAEWMPHPVVLGPRILRWVRAELEAAALNMPRQREPQPMPAQLRRKKIDAAKGAAA